MERVRLASRQFHAHTLDNLPPDGGEPYAGAFRIPSDGNQGRHACHGRHGASGCIRPGDRDGRPGSAARGTRRDCRHERGRLRCRRLGRGTHLRTDHEWRTRARTLELPLGPAGPGRLGDPRSRNPRCRHRGAHRGLVRSARVGTDAGLTRGRRAGSGRGRRMGRPTHKDDEHTGRALRR